MAKGVLAHLVWLDALSPLYVLSYINRGILTRYIVFILTLPT